MNIILRTSGGRGEYELAGSQQERRVADVSGRVIFFSITPEISIPGRSVCLPASESQGKPRIRLENSGRSGEQHAYLVLRSLLLLPEPIRQLSETSSGPLVLENRAFSVNAIGVDILSVDAKTVVFRPTVVEFRNASDSRRSLVVADRMAKILEIWRVAQASNSPLAILVKAHRAIALDSPDAHTALHAAASAIQNFFTTSGEYLEKVANALGASLPEPDLNEDSTVVRPAEEDPTPLIIAKRRNLKVWRQQIVRGPEAARFRQEVRTAYGSVCAFSGHRLPKLSIANSAGVDAAHILPWSRYDLNHVSNGLCLSKLFHWAFDNGIVRLDFLPLSGRFQLSVPNIAREVAEAEGMDLAPFLPHLGQLPIERFPQPPHRPSAAFLDQLNAELF